MPIDFKDTDIIILAAGKGKRMQSDLPKVMHSLHGRPLVDYVVKVAEDLGVRPTVVVGARGDLIKNFLGDRADYAEQNEQLGTGHAIMQTESALKDFIGDVVVLSGDVPLLTAESMRGLISHHHQTDAIATILTADFVDPTGYGRIIRNNDGSVKKIIEHKDATEAERLVKEINSGIYVFNGQMLFDGLQYITPQNVQNEYYLTDVFEYFCQQHWKVSAIKTSHVEEIMGVNTVNQLDEVVQILLKRTGK